MASLFLPEGYSQRLASVCHQSCYVNADGVNMQRSEVAILSFLSKKVLKSLQISRSAKGLQIKEYLPAAQH